MKTHLWAIILILSTLFLTDPSSASNIPDTGQVTGYTSVYGEDADYSANPPTYTKLDDQGNPLSADAAEWHMVRDEVTGLIWEAKSSDASIHGNSQVYDWLDAQNVFIASLNSTGFGGFSDWRLPTPRELTTIVSRDASFPCVNTIYFPNAAPTSYWTAASYVPNPAYAWLAFSKCRQKTGRNRPFFRVGFNHSGHLANFRPPKPVGTRIMY